MSQRTLRIAASVRNTLLEVLPSYTSIWSESGCLITDVFVTPDLSIAKVYVMVSRGDSEQVISELNQHKKTFTKKISDINNFRRALEVRFLRDESFAHSQECERIRQLLLEDERA